MEYYLDNTMKWQPLTQKNIDFGGGFERAVMCLQDKRDIFETDLFANSLKTIAMISGKEYKNGAATDTYTSAFRVIADHARAAAFIISDGIKPSNKDQGYILRRFIRRMVRFGKKLGIETNFGKDVVTAVIETMGGAYPQLKDTRDLILNTVDQEESAFRRTLVKGLKEIEKQRETSKSIDGKTAFTIYETFGFPIEMTLEEFKSSPEETERIMQEFKKVELEHKEQSRKGAEQKFKGGLADQSVEVIKLHTAHHLLLKALQTILSPTVKQRGSNITGERLRIDFNYDQKLTDEQIKAAEDFVNAAIRSDYQVVRQDMPRSEAEKLGAEMEFGQKYPDIVSVYQILDDKGNAISKEFCGGPHVARTGEIGAGGKTFKIIAQENIGSGLRRIKAGLI
jgi:alanyl-tRNA synthetase